MGIEFTFQESFKLRDFFEVNSQKFENILLTEAVNVKDKINEILLIGNIDLVNNAHRVAGYIIEAKDEELEAFANQEGVAWAMHSIPLSFKLEWVQAIRRSLWAIIKQYNELKAEESEGLNFFQLELEINSRVDKFLNSFFISYSSFKDKLIKEQKELVENLSVPIIPINASISIVPLIGSIDSSRIDIFEEKILTEIGNARIQTLIMDLSGIADMEGEQIEGLKKIIDGISMMGCTAVITGLRKEIVRKITSIGIIFSSNMRITGTLQQALRDYYA